MLFVVKDNIPLNTIITDNDTEVYSLTSLKEGYSRLNILPQTNIYYKDERQFDIDYFNWIFNNDIVFKEFFKIIYALYFCKDVVLLVSNSDEYNYTIYSVLKIIEQRYGYIATHINDISDLKFISDYDSDFSIAGLYNLDIDRDRYVTLLALSGELE